MANMTPTMKFYLTYSITEARKHKCNTCLGICSVFLVVVIAATCYTLVANAAVVFFRQAEQAFGEYDILITPKTEPFFNYSLMASILNQRAIKYHSPRLLYNHSSNYLFSSACYQNMSTDRVYDNDGCAAIITNDTKCHVSSGNQLNALAFWLLDFEKEDAMGFGRNFNSKNKPKPNGMIITSSVARKLNLNVDDMVYLMLPLSDTEIPLLSSYIQQLFVHNGFDTQNNTHFDDLIYKIQTECAHAVLPVQISMISSDKSLGGKFPELKTRWNAVMDITLFLELLMEHLPPSVSSTIDSYNHNNSYEANIYDSVNRVYINLGKDRVSSYLSTNYQNIQRALVGFASKVSYYLGWIEMDIRLDLLSSMHGSSQTMLSLGVVLDIIIFVLIVLSILLLYSLLVISIASKTFTMGIFRMLGMSRKHLVVLLESQSLAYSIPAWIIGLIVAQIGAVFVLKLLGSSSNIELNPLLTSTSIIIATIVGIGMSLIASILPIRAALGNTLQSSLDIHHSKTAAVKFDINRSDGQAFAWSLFWINIVLVTLGWTVYYFFPQSILSGNLELFAVMLMVLMLCILVGCVLLGLNLQHLTERFVLWAALSWWERRPIPQIVLKNLIAHKVRNRKTALMYAFSLSFIFFVTVMISTQLSVLQMANIRDFGTKLFCWTSRAGKPFEDVLNQIEYIDDYAWKLGPVWGTSYSDDFRETHTWIENIGRTYHEDAWISPTMPNFCNVVEQEYIVAVNPSTYDYRRTSMGSTEQLFTAYGSQRMLIGEHISNRLHLKSVDDELLLDLYSETSVQYHKLRTLQWFQLYPFYRLITLHTGWPAAAAVIPLSAVPRFFNTSNGFASVEDGWFTAVLIKFRASVLNSEIDETKRILSPWCYSIKDYRTVEKQVAEASGMLDLIFSFMTYAALCLCLFSLVSSMFANITNGTKEIGILRSMGLTKFQINKIYIYEALCIILSSSLLGFGVGYVVSFVIVQQQILFSQFPIQLIVPSSVIFAVTTGAIFTSIASVYFPLALLNKKQIAQNLRDLVL
eukprot:59145_1